MAENMSADATKFLEALTSLQDAIDSYGNKSKFSDSFNPNAAPLTASDLYAMVGALHEKFNIDWSGAHAESAQQQFDDLTPKIEFATDNLVPHLHSSAHVSEALLTFVYAIDLQVSDLVTHKVVDQILRLPADTRKELRAAHKRFEHANNSIGDLESKVKTINDAYSSASSLPTTLSDLEAAASDIATSRDAVLRHEADAKQRAADADVAKKEVESVLAQANQALLRVNAAFRAATSEGLAKEFKAKAQRLNISVGIWVAVLVAALLAAAYVGSERFPQLLASMAALSNKGEPKWGLVFAQLLVSALSLGAPVWLAWVATKQIGERFRLAEDYAYKAALSSAYEGYRSEAVNLDPVFQAQLFSIALSRLDEIPLRLVDKHVAGSPMHELLKSPEFKEALEKTPSLRDALRRFTGQKNAPEGDKVSPSVEKEETQE